MAGNGPFTGKVFSGRYQIGELIGQGGMAEVYSAQDMTLGRIVAVKTMLPQYASDPDFTRRFRQEAAAAANLQSPYIVNVYDWGHDQDTYFIVMEYVRGSDLKTAIQQRGAINQRKVAEIGSQVCQALTVAHQQDIIHRDIKPQNIMIQPDGNVKVMDFGIARSKNSTADKTETVLGTAHYTSPEQAQGKDLTYSSDIYSLGVVLYEAATGTLPFDGPDAVSVALMQVREEPPTPRSINPDIDPTFEAIILTAMQKDPAGRFATAGDMRKALNSFLTGQPINWAALLAGGAAAAIAAGLIAEQPGAASFTNAHTSVMQPINGGMDTTQVMSPIGMSGQTATMGGIPPASGDARHYNSSDTIPKKKSKKGPVIAIIVIIAAIAAIAAFMLFSGDGAKEIPDVVGLKYEEAIRTLKEASFQTGEIETAFDDDVESGTVLQQDPTAETTAEKGTKVNLVVSQGSEQVPIPDVVGMSLSSAQKTLTDDDFIVGSIVEENSEDVPSGDVINQEPSSGSSANKGSVVNLFVSSGVEQVSVPNIVGKSESEADNTAANAGLTPNTTSREYSDSVPEGCVISQNPSPGEKVDKGSTLSYVLSKGEDSTEIPDVVGSNEDYATAALENAGFKVKVTESYSDKPEGNVISQTPTGSAKEGATVTIEVSKGEKETPAPTPDPDEPDNKPVEPDPDNNGGDNGGNEGDGGNTKPSEGGNEGGNEGGGSEDPDEGGNEGGNEKPADNNKNNETKPANNTKPADKDSNAKDKE